MSTPLLTAMFALMIVIAWLAGVEPWMIGIGAVLAVVGYLLERRRDDSGDAADGDDSDGDD